MSYEVPGQMPPQPGAPRTRPTVVTASSALLFIVAGLYVLDFITLLSQTGTISDVYEEVYAGTELEGNEGIAVGVSVGIGVLFLLFAVGFALLAVFNNLGKNGSRITTWVIGGIVLCCTGVGLVFQGVGAGAGMDTVEGVDQAEIESMIADATPGWYEAYTWLSGIGGLLAVIAAMVLLMLPAANEYFRKPPEDVFEPPPSQPPA